MPSFDNTSNVVVGGVLESRQCRVRAHSLTEVREESTRARCQSSKSRTKSTADLAHRDRNGRRESSSTFERNNNNCSEWMVCLAERQRTLVVVDVVAQHHQSSENTEIPHVKVFWHFEKEKLRPQQRHDADHERQFVECLDDCLQLLSWYRYKR